MILRTIPAVAFTVNDLINRKEAKKLQLADPTGYRNGECRAKSIDGTLPNTIVQQYKP